MSRLPRRSLSIRLRLTLWYSLVLVLVAAIFAAVVLWQQQRIGVSRIDGELEAFTTTLDNVLRDELTETSDPVEAAEEAQRTVAAPGRGMAILRPDGTVLAAAWRGLSIDLHSSPPGARVWTADTSNGAWRVHVVPSVTPSGTFVLLAAAPLADVLRERRQAAEAMWVALPIVLLFSIGGGLWLASVGLRPMSDMARRAEIIAPGGVDDLGESDRRDELGTLARAFNGLVARLRQALHTQRQFMADASHELRTPVSIIQSTADVTLERDERDPADYREALHVVRGEARRLGRLVDDMLVLARADAGGYPLRREHLYLNEVAADCQRAVQPLARERAVKVSASAPADVPFAGDESLIRRMLLNVVQNAVAYTREGTAVHVDVSPNGRNAYIRVSDHGCGVAIADRARIFDRFVQLDAARRGAGVGLGLPIAKWIAEAHGGSLELERTDDSGSTFRITLPLPTR